MNIKGLFGIPYFSEDFISFLDGDSCVCLSRTSKWFAAQLSAFAQQKCKDEHIQRLFGLLGKTESLRSLYHEFGYRNIAALSHFEYLNSHLELIFTPAESSEIRSEQLTRKIDTYFQKMDLYYTKLLAVPPLNEFHPLQDLRDRQQRLRLYQELRQRWRGELLWPDELRNLHAKVIVIGQVTKENGNTYNIEAMFNRLSHAESKSHSFRLAGTDKWIDITRVVRDQDDLNEVYSIPLVSPLRINAAYNRLPAHPTEPFLRVTIFQRGGTDEVDPCMVDLVMMIFMRAQEMRLEVYSNYPNQWLAAGFVANNHAPYPNELYLEKSARGPLSFLNNVRTSFITNDAENQEQPVQINNITWEQRLKQSSIHLKGIGSVLVSIYPKASDEENL